MMESKENAIVPTLEDDSIRSRIFTIRGVQVMLDRDLAELYGVEVKYLNRQVKCNLEHFPDDFIPVEPRRMFKVPNWHLKHGTRSTSPTSWRRFEITRKD